MAFVEKTVREVTEVREVTTYVIELSQEELNNVYSLIYNGTEYRAESAMGLSDLRITLGGAGAKEVFGINSAITPEQIVRL
jgi:hypothetical protein